MANFGMTQRVNNLRKHNPSSISNRTKLNFSRTNVLPTRLMYAWYDASDSSSIVRSGNQIVQWKDKSDKNNHLTTIILNPPSYYLETQKGLNVATFSSSGSICNTSMNVPATSQSWFMVCKIMQTTGNGSSIMSYINPVEQGQSSWQIYAYDNECFVGALARGLAPTGPITLEYNKPRIFGGQCLGNDYHMFEIEFNRETSTTSVYLDGILKDTKLDNLPWNPSSSIFKMFVNRAGNQFCLGAVAETICIGSVAPDDVQIIRKYLTAKWL